MNHDVNHDVFHMPLEGRGQCSCSIHNKAQIVNVAKFIKGFIIKDSLKVSSLIYIFSIQDINIFVSR